MLMISAFETAAKRADMPAAIPNPMKLKVPFLLTWLNTHLSVYWRQCQWQSRSSIMAPLQHIVTTTTTLSVTWYNCPQGVSLARRGGQY